MKILKTIYDIFPAFNRPMAVCALLSAMSILFLYKYENVAVSALILIAISLLALCIVTKGKKIFIVSVCALAICASAVNEFMTVKDLETLDGQTVTADFVAIEDSYCTDKVSRITVYCTDKNDVLKNSKLSLYYFSDDEIMCGSGFNAKVKLSSLEDSDFKLYNYGNSVYMDCQLLKVDKYYSPNGFWERIGAVRRYMIDTLKQKFPDDISSVLIALNCGERRYLSDEFSNKVRICGVSHVMVVSGLHISIIIGLLFKLFEKYYYNRYLKTFVSALIIFGICAICGFTLSSVRAGIMFMFFVISPLLLRQNDGLNSLGSAVVLILFLSPFSIFSVGFLLSVTATLSVVWISPFYTDLICKKLLIGNKYALWAISVFVVSVCAMIFTAPISIYVFGTFSLISPITFLLITFPVTAALASNTAALIISSVKGISFLSEPFFLVSGLCAKYIKLIIDNLGALDFMLIKADVFAIILFLLLILGLIFNMYLYKFYVKLKKRQLVSEVKANGGYIRKRA